MTGWEAGKTPLNSLGLQGLDAAATSSGGSAQMTVRDATYLIGYATSGRQPYIPDAWRSVLLMRTDVAFAPLTALLWKILILSVILAALAAAASFVWADQFSRPIMLLVPVPRSGAGGELPQRSPV